MTSRRTPSLLLALLLLAVSAMLDTTPVFARAGGGHSYSGGHSRSSGGHSGSGGSRSGGGSRSRGGVVPIVPYSRPSYPSSPSSPGSAACGCVFLLVLLLVVALIVFLVVRAARAKGAASPPPPPPPPPTRGLEAIRDLDPDFSAVLFEDFVYALYARAHEARANPHDREALSPYLSAAVRGDLARREPAGVPVTAVVVGALRVLDVALPAPGATPAQVMVWLEIESNVTEGTAGAAGHPGNAQTQYIRERWRLVRDAAARTKPPVAVRTFPCPNCGAPFTSGSDRCEYCGEVVSGGRFDWSVEEAVVEAAEDRPPALTGTVEEEGTDLPTVVHPDLAERRAALLRDDPAATDEALAARLKLIYDELQSGWTKLDLAPVRPFVSDGLFDYLQYWITAYQAQGLRNVLVGMRVTRLELAKVVRDRWFDAVTFRVWGAGRDSTVEQRTGRLVGGDPDHDRLYTEYWTLIRGAGVRGAPRADKSCPQCGAPLDTNMAGQCQHCGAKVTSGEFDWVLSKIEQDDSYTG